MRLYYNGRTIEGLKKYLEEKVRDEELRKLIEEKEGCCKKCHGYYLEPRHEYFPLCSRKDCECHEELKKLLEQKDKEDEKEMRELMFQGDNMSFSG